MGKTQKQEGHFDNIGEILPKTGKGVTPIRVVLQQKASREVSTVGPKTSVFDALTLMAGRNIGALVVMEAGRVAGVVSERDYARKVILIGKNSHETTVAEIMGTPPVTVTTSATVGECLALMTERFLRHLPVVDEGLLVGLVSIGDLVKALLVDQEERLGRIEAYISGTYPA
jgi:CBS domain-containing protein